MSAEALLATRARLVEFRRMTDLDDHDADFITLVLGFLDDALDAIRDGTSHVPGIDGQTSLYRVKGLLLGSALCGLADGLQALMNAEYQRLIDEGART
ncbi:MULTISPECIES: hypothetical protein [Burkholderia]|uniref:hypothetical protein n=1 Tax=Burkholderia TaxID=32008 RepID=UPI0011AD1EEC|nr:MULTISPECIES: hypothetical protein [Burkholderia cepacia complex]MDN7893335.1 hypothetical protein [Burkholderia cepacia]